MRITDYKVLLASNSPRREELLRGLDIDFEIKVLPDIDESYPSDLPVSILTNTPFFRVCKYPT